jgi:glycerophosphoryl diester phosphodiesterase
MDWRARRVGLRVGGHRGAAADAPENTYAAFEAAVEQGAAYTETDIRLSADAQLVLMHDPTLDRTTDARGPVSAKRLDELRKVDAGSWFGHDFAGERIPEFEPFLRWVEERAPFGAALEVKASGIGARVAELAWASPAREHLAIYAFDAAEIRAAKSVCPDLPCLLLLRLTDDPGKVIARIEACGADGADVPWQWRALALTAEMQARGLLVGGGSSDGGQAARELVEMGADVIDTDRPAALLGAVAELVSRHASDQEPAR